MILQQIKIVIAIPARRRR